MMLLFERIARSRAQEQSLVEQSRQDHQSRDALMRDLLSLPAEQTKPPAEPLGGSVPSSDSEKVGPQAEEAPVDAAPPSSLETTPPPSVAPWATFSEAHEEALSRARWKIVDLETTGLTPASEPVKLTTKEAKAGYDNRLRPRILSAVFPGPAGIEEIAWDLDLLSDEERQRLACAALQKVFIGHNAAFDIGWLQTCAKRRVSPSRVLDTLILARILVPDHVIRFMQRAGHDPVAKDLANKGKAGWSLETLVYLHLGCELMDKEMQKPKNWCEPAPLSQRHFNYALSDVKLLRKLLLSLLGSDQNADLLEVWDAYVEGLPSDEQTRVRSHETYPLVLADMRANGMPVDFDHIDQYVGDARSTAQSLTDQLVELEPELDAFRERLVDIDGGMTADLKEAIAAAFRRRGVSVSRTPKSLEPQVGEKDLRGALATQNPESEALFKPLTKLYRIKKRAQMAEQIRVYADRSEDKRIHSLFAPSTQTLRLSCSELNVQQWPSEQEFRNICKARKKRKIIGCDFSALDVRVGAALAVRAQYKFREALDSGNFSSLTDDVQQVAILRDVLCWHDVDAAVAEYRGRIQPAIDAARQHGGWGRYFEVKKTLFACELVSLWRKLQAKAEQTGETDGAYSALRIAFRMGADIHSYTALRFLGRDPVEEIAALPQNLQANYWQAILPEIEASGQRKRGKVSNLSLMYAMSAETFREDAAKKYDVHWTLEEATSTRESWFETYPEIAFWGLFTRLTAVTQDNRQQRLMGYDATPGIRKNRQLIVFPVQTLTGRTLYAEGISAGLNYPDQGTGADIVAEVMTRMRAEQPELYAGLINQVHDELVVEAPEDVAQARAQTLKDLMVSCGARHTEPFGIPMQVSVSIDDHWLKG